MEHLTFSVVLVRMGIVVVLVAANAFFVAAEFALVAARPTRLEALAAAGDHRAKVVLSALGDLYRHLSAAQLGITVSSILLGFVAEETIAELLREWLRGLPPAVAFLGRAGMTSVIAVSVVSFLHVVVGEQAPKAWAITFPEPASRLIVRPLMFFAWITGPVTNLLNGSANFLVRTLGLGDPSESHRVHSPEEILMLLHQSQEEGHIDRDDVSFIQGVFRFAEKSAREVMTPRTDVIGLELELTVQEAAARVAEVGRSRYPVYRGTIDDVVGVVHAKTILAELRDGGEKGVREIMQSDVLFVPGTRDVAELLGDMRHRKQHFAIVLDEYGGVAGIVTMEDLLEEIVGQIYDEYDAPPSDEGSTGAAALPGGMDLGEAQRLHDLNFGTDRYHTIGGFVFGELGRLPQVGDRVPVAGGVLEVTGMDGRRVSTVQFVRTRRVDAGGDSRDTPTSA